jgi:hypothetical protein
MVDDFNTLAGRECAVTVDYQTLTRLQPGQDLHPTIQVRRAYFDRCKLYTRSSINHPDGHRAGRRYCRTHGQDRQRNIASTRSPTGAVGWVSRMILRISVTASANGSTHALQSTTVPHLTSTAHTQANPVGPGGPQLVKPNVQPQTRRIRLRPGFARYRGPRIGHSERHCRQPACETQIRCSIMAA